MRWLGLVAAVVLGGCLDSVVGGECRPGWVADGTGCQLLVDEPDGGRDVDAGPADIDAGPVDVDAAVCVGGTTWCGACVDVASDPDHCGACGTACGSGICSASACVGAVAGHVVVIGHDYRVHRAAAARVLGNAAVLNGVTTARVALAAGADAEPAATTAVAQALTTGLAAVGRTWLSVDLDGAAPSDRSVVDVFVILPRAAAAPTSFAEGWAWRADLAGFMAAGGTVIGLDGPGGTTADLLRGAEVIDVTSAATATGRHVAIAAPGDALAVGVPSPYLAERGTTTFTLDAAAGTTVAAVDGAAVVIHATIAAAP